MNSTNVFQFPTSPTLPGGTIQVSPVSEKLSVSEVEDAVYEGRLEMHYQPQYDMRTGDTVAAEALVRLVDAEGHLIHPDRFIDAVEHSDLIVPFGRAVIEQVCAGLAAVRAEHIPLKRIAINLSAHQLNLDSMLVEFINQMLKHHELGYEDLEFELTERQALGANDPGVDTLRVLAERGARLVVDDFGTGYSSVLCLTELPVSAFKLDCALVSRLPEDQRVWHVVQNLLTLASDLELEVIAEGVETQEQDEILTGAGCPFAQGFGYARPMAESTFRAFLKSNSPSPDSAALRASV